MGLPNSEMPNVIQSPPGIAYSKSDLEGTTNYLYAAYYDFDESIGEYRLHHAFKPWGTSTFKGTKDLKTGQGTYPNPFSNVINTSVNLNAAGTVKLELFDVTGKLVAQQKSALAAGTHTLQLAGLADITSGVYFLNSTVNGAKIASQTVIKK
jgi:hypothetical protein